MVQVLRTHSRISEELEARLGVWVVGKAEVTGGVMRAVCVRRRVITVDVALRYRFA